MVELSFTYRDGLRLFAKGADGIVDHVYQLEHVLEPELNLCCLFRTSCLFKESANLSSKNPERPFLPGL